MFVLIGPTFCVKFKEIFLNPEQHVQDGENEWPNFSGGLAGAEISEFCFRAYMDNNNFYIENLKINLTNFV